jgi:hypothetical protein
MRTRTCTIAALLSMPALIPAARLTMLGQTAMVAPPVSIVLGAPRQLFQYNGPDAMGLFNVPDMHTAILQWPDKSYGVWITGNIGPVAGAVAELSTKDFLHFENAGPGGPRAEPVFAPSCREPTPPARGRGRAGRRGSAAAARGSADVGDCVENYDADYVGANTILTSASGKDLLMLYEAGNKSAGGEVIAHGWEYNVMALARSADKGRTWRREGVVLSGTDPKPTARTTVAQPGISEPGALVADGFIYLLYQYIANRASDDGPSVIQAARAPVSSDGIPGAWLKYFQGSFSQPGLGGQGTTILATANSGCTRPVEVWPARSSYLNAYVLTYLCNEGWFFSTSTDLVTWTAPTNFLPMAMWQSCQPMDWNFMLVTPGNPAGVIGQTGYVLFAHSDAKGLNCTGRFSPHMPWIRPFTFSQR